MSTQPSYPRHLPKLKGFEDRKYFDPAQAEAAAKLIVHQGGRQQLAKATPELLQQKSAEDLLRKKVDQVGRVLDRHAQRIDMLDQQIAALSAKKSHLQERVERIENELLSRMQEHSLDEVAGYKDKFRQHPCPPSLVVENEALIPQEYFRIPKAPKPAPDKVLIKKALERGEAIQGVTLMQNVTLQRVDS